MGRRCDNEDYEGAEDPMSPSKNKGKQFFIDYKSIQTTNEHLTSKGCI